MKSSTITTQAKRVMFFPGGAGRGMIVTVAFAQTTVLRSVLDKISSEILYNAHTCFPMLVSPRASLRLWTGFTIQFILGSRRI